ncbi:hypothetical protein [Microbacterium testaceum]|uniref:hypothetical protein n=1 Tax=Microbacterium testaceum TaxID=2033 RepID=UPI00382565E0
MPAVILVASTPAFAASGRTLSFSSTSYTGTSCGTITTAVVRATDGSTAEAGVSVVLQLSTGWTFDGGGTTATVVTGSDGSVSCGTIHVPAGNTTGTLSATASGATGASASLTSSDAQILTSPSGLADASGIPGGATPIAQGFFLSGGTLYLSGTGSVATGIDSVGRLVEAASKSGSFLLPMRRSDGSAAIYDTGTGAVTTATGTPSGSTPLAADLFRSGNTIYRGGTAITTDVDRAGQLIEHDGGNGSSGTFYLPYLSTAGEPRILRLPQNDVRTASEYGASNGPGSGATPIADDLFLWHDDIYRVSWDGTSAYGTGVVASGVSAFGSLTPNPYYSGERLLPVTRNGGGQNALFMVSGNSLRDTSQVPTSSTPIGADLFLSNGAIYQDAVGVVASTVASNGIAAPASYGSNKVVVPLTVSASC